MNGRHHPQTITRRDHQVHITAVQTLKRCLLHESYRNAHYVRLGEETSARITAEHDTHNRRRNR